MNCIFNCGEGGITNVVSQARLEPSARVLIPPKEMGIKKTLIGFILILIAVREGFEPSVQFPVRQFSKLLLSASQSPHRIMGMQN